jgi:alpha-N-arabinofuranosidase
VHQDAKYLPVQISSPDYTVDGQKLPSLNVSASQDSTGATHISLVNLDPNNDIVIRTALNGISWKTVGGQIITSAKFTDVNTFEKKDAIKPAVFNGANKEGNDLVVNLPKLSVVVLELK